MNWLSLFSGLVSLFNKGAAIFKNRQLMKAGEAKAKLEILQEEKRNAQRATNTRNNPSSDARRKRMLRHPNERK